MATALKAVVVGAQEDLAVGRVVGVEPGEREVGHQHDQGDAAGEHEDALQARVGSHAAQVERRRPGRGDQAEHHDPSRRQHPLARLRKRVHMSGLAEQHEERADRDARREPTGDRHPEGPAHDHARERQQRRQTSRHQTALKDVVASVARHARDEEGVDHRLAQAEAAGDQDGEGHGAHRKVERRSGQQKDAEGHGDVGGHHVVEEGVERRPDTRRAGDLAQPEGRLRRARHAGLGGGGARAGGPCHR